MVKMQLPGKRKEEDLRGGSEGEHCGCCNFLTFGINKAFLMMINPILEEEAKTKKDYALSRLIK